MITEITDQYYEPGPDLAAAFFDDILDVYDSLSAVSDAWGEKTLIQAHYFTYGLLKNDPSVIDPDPEYLGDGFVGFLKTLLGHQHYFAYLERCKNFRSSNQRKPAL